MKQEDDTHQGHDDEFFQQFVPQVFHGALNQAGTIIDRHDFHTLRQPGLECLQPGFDTINGFLRILAKAHDHNAAYCLTLAIEFGNAPAHLWPDFDVGHIL